MKIKDFDPQEGLIVTIRMITGFEARGKIVLIEPETFDVFDYETHFNWTISRNSDNELLKAETEDGIVIYESPLNIENSEGDNFPSYNTIHIRKILNKERTSFIQKLLIEEQGKITNEEIVDTIIDIELYNKNCKKKRRKKKSDNL